jgi:hypothetical protein
VSFIHYEKKEIHFEVVYAGPPAAGKATNLAQIVSATSPARAPGSPPHVLVSLGPIRGFSVTAHLLALSTREEAEVRERVLRAPDGILFVADSRPGMLDANLEAYRALTDALWARGMDISKLAFALQANKQDFAGAVAPAVIAARLGVAARPFFGSSATTRTGVFEPLKEVCKQVLQALAKG